MRSEDKSVFVAKRTYQGRRLADAARLMPVLGIGLFSLPIMWKGATLADGSRTVGVMLYLFLAWVFLAGATAVISKRLKSQDDQAQDERQEG